MPHPIRPSRRTWASKFGHAFRGLKQGIRGENSFYVHLFFATIVVVAAALLRMERWEWCVLLLCIGGVLSAEMFNSALERLAAAVDTQPNPLIRDALDISSAAVLTIAVGASVVGLLVFLQRFCEALTL